LRDAADIAALHEVFVDKEYNFNGDSLKTIIDIGGHIGTATLFFASKYPQAHITVYEPEPGNFAVLEKNMDLIKNVSCINAAVSDTEGTIDFYASQSSIASSIYERKNSKKIQVRSILLDSILKDPVDIVKFDIEGAEYRMFSSSERRQTPRIFIGELHYDLMGADLETFLTLFRGYRSTIRPISASRSIALLEKT
jgi:FkbM family methyltransferase